MYSYHLLVDNSHKDHSLHLWIRCILVYTGSCKFTCRHHTSSHHSVPAPPPQPLIYYWYNLESLHDTLPTEANHIFKETERSALLLSQGDGRSRAQPLQDTHLITFRWKFARVKRTRGRECSGGWEARCQLVSWGLESVNHPYRHPILMITLLIIRQPAAES